MEIGILIKDILSGVVSIYYRFKIRAYIFLECLWVYLKKKRLPCYQRFSNAVSLLLAWKCKCKCKKENGNKLKYTIVLCTGKRFLLREFDFLWPSPSWPFYRLATTVLLFSANFCSFKVKLFFGARGEFELNQWYYLIFIKSFEHFWPFRIFQTACLWIKSNLRIYMQNELQYDSIPNWRQQRAFFLF